MKRIFIRAIAAIMVMLTLCSSVPLTGLADFGWMKASAVEEGLSSVATVQKTGYGVLDTDVVATKVTLGDGYYFNTHDVNYNDQMDNYGQGYVLVEDEAGTTYYLVGTKGVVKSFYSDSGTKPSFTLLYEYSIDTPHALYRVYNPETKKYDVYNANTCQYFEYQLDSLTCYNVSGYDYEYAKNVIEIKKDNKYGLINSKGQMLYEPIYQSIRSFKNCFIGSCKSEYGYTCYAVLSNKGVTSGTKLYDKYLVSDDILFAVSDIEPNENWDTADYMDWALLNADLTLMTDFVYSDVEIAESNGTYYRVCSRYYTEPDAYGYTESFYQHQVISDKGNSWDVCQKFNCISSSVGIYNSSVSVCENGLKIYITDDYGYYDKNGTGWVNPDLVAPEFTRRYILAKPNGEAVFDYPATDENVKEIRNKWDSVKGIYGKCVHRQEYINSKYVDNLYDSKGNLISKISLSNMTVMGDYLVYDNYSSPEESFIYDYVNEKMVIDHIYISSITADSAGVCFAESETSGQWAIFDTATGEYTDYSISANSLYVTGCIANGTRKLWVCFGDDQYIYVNDKAVVLSSANSNDGPGSLLQSGDYLLKNISSKWGYYATTYEVEILDYDGNVKNSFIRKVYGGAEPADVYISTDASGNPSGLVDQSGKILIDCIVENMGNCYNGLTYVVDDDYGAVVDNLGNALMYGKFDIDDYGRSYKTVGVSGFASFVKDNEVYIYDFTACHGFDQNTASSVVTEDHLFGEYHDYLNNGFYNSLTDTAGNQVANALSHYGKNAQNIAFVKSALDGQTGYVVKKLVDFIPGTSLNETKAKQEMALEYLNSLDTEAASKYLQVLSDANDLISKINDANKLDYDLKSEKSKAEFVKIWTTGTGFTSSEIYGVIDAAKKHQDRFDAYFKITGRTIKTLEYVSSYLTIYLLQKDLVKSLLDMVPRNSDLHEGLSYIYAKQSKSGTVVTLVAEMLTDDILSVVGDLTEKGLMKLAGVKNANVALLILSVGCKIASETIDSPKLEEIDKAVLAYANMITLKTAVNDYQERISDNHSNGGGIPIDTLKAEYSLLCDTYYKSIFTALKYAKAIAPDKEKPIIAKHTDEFEKKLIYRSYIKTCLLNARTQWEYTVENNKAVITKLKAEYPMGEGRVPYMDLYNSSFNENDAMNKVVYDYEYAIDVPATIDGYEVGAVGTASFSDNNRVTGIYVPDTVTEIQSSAFKNCNQINTVYLGASVETIGDSAFENCSDLGLVELPDSVSSVGQSSFTGVDELLLTGSDRELLDRIASDNITTQARDLTAVKLEIVEQPTKVEFYLQDEIDSAGLVLKVTYTDGSTKEVVEGFYADIRDRQLGENTVVVSCEGLEVEYSVNILASQCDYTVVYQDEWGNEISGSFNGTALAGTEVELEIPQIAGYIPVCNVQTELIGYRNHFVVKYKQVPLKSLAEAIVTIKDYDVSCDTILEIAVVLDGTTLERDVDYIVGYDTNLRNREGFAVVQGIGQYEGVVSAEFIAFESEHRFTEYVEYEATCTENLTKVAQCDHGCGAYDWVEVAGTKLGHVYSSEYTVDRQPSCNWEGSKSRHCTREDCYSKTSVTVIPKLDHSYDNACAEYCNRCYSFRVAPHSYLHDCSTLCSLCGLERTNPTANHIPGRNSQCSVCGEEAILIGDINGDGKLNVADVSKVYAYTKGIGTVDIEKLMACCDINGDGKVNIADVSKMYAHTKGINPLF